ncbi:MAG: outer membrane lipoprotein-sorting protein [Halanaerobium sp.]
MLRNLFKKKKLFLMTMVLILIFSFSVSAVTGREVMEEVDDRDTGNSRHALMGMDLIDDNGEVKERVIEVWSKNQEDNSDLDQTVMVFYEPSSVKDTRFLQEENEDADDDQWIYLPDLGRVRRISGSQGSNSFMGSDFSYDDLKSREIDDFEYELLREEKLGEYETYVVEAVPKDPEEEQYQKTISWVTKKHYIPVKVEMYDKDSGDLYKEMTVEQNIEKINGIWTVFSTKMENLDTGHSTVMYVKERDGNYMIEYNTDINDKLFTQQFLETGR